MRKYISVIIVFVLSLCFIGLQNQVVSEAAWHSYSVPGKSVEFWDEAKNFILVPEFSSISGRGYGAYADLSSAVVKENGLYAFVCNRAKAGDNDFRTTGTLYIKVINEKTHQFEFRYDGEGINNYEWRKVGNVDMDTVLYILDSIQSRGMSTGNISPTSPSVQDPMSINLMKCWQEDVDASTGADEKILSTYPGMPIEEFYNNFANWNRVVTNNGFDFGDANLYKGLTYCYMERGNKALKEELGYVLLKDGSFVVDRITFKTNQRLLSRQIFERFKKNLSALYRERSMSPDGTHLMYGTHDNYMVGHLTLHTDYAKEAYSVTWTGLGLAD